MAERSAIEWTDATWNPIRGCTPVSEGCRNCYAARVAARFSGPGQPYEGLARHDAAGRPQWTGTVRFIPEHLADPLRWQKPRLVFVNSMSDVFHESVTVDVIARIWAVMAAAQRHTFQVLTKRPERAADVLNDPRFWHRVGFETARLEAGGVLTRDHVAAIVDAPKPLPNVWLGTSVEDQETADKRVPAILEAPAVVRFLSCEPLLGPVDLKHALVGLEFGALHWVIAGGESGRGARPMHADWVRGLRYDCRDLRVAFFFKQWGEYHPTRPAGRDDSAPDALMSDGTRLWRVGKKRAGRVLDGRTHDEMPDVRDDVLEGGARCARCGCTEDRACPGGCAWLAVDGLTEDVCTTCATPEELARHEASVDEVLAPVREAFKGGRA